MEAMIGLLLSWPDKWCAVLNILCQKILCQLQSVDTYVPRLALEAGARSWSPKALVKNRTSISLKLHNMI